MNITRNVELSSIFPSTYQSTNRMDALLDAIGNLSGMDLVNFKDDIIKAFNKIVDKEENFFLHDYTDNWFYMVNYQDGDVHLFHKGKDAFKEYENNHAAIAITRKTKDLYPTYQVMMSKVEGFVYIPQKKGKKDMSKKDYDLKYQREKLKRIYFTLNKENDDDIITFLAQQDNVQGLLKRLIREEIKRTE